jgi:hypothetical protein
MATQMKMVLIPSWCIFVEKEGRPIGFALALPDMNQIIRGLGGRLLPFGWLKMLLGKSRCTSSRVITMGVRKEFQGRGIDSILYHGITKAITDAGVGHGELGWVLETNAAMNNALERAGGRVSRTYRVSRTPATRHGWFAEEAVVEAFERSDRNPGQRDADDDVDHVVVAKVDGRQRHHDGEGPRPEAVTPRRAPDQDRADERDGRMSGWEAVALRRFGVEHGETHLFGEPKSREGIALKSSRATLGIFTGATGPRASNGCWVRCSRGPARNPRRRDRFHRRGDQAARDVSLTETRLPTTIRMVATGRSRYAV